MPAAFHAKAIVVNYEGFASCVVVMADFVGELWEHWSRSFADGMVLSLLSPGTSSNARDLIIEPSYIALIVTTTGTHITK